MTDHPNLALVRRSYEALQAGDVAFLESTAADGFTFEVSGTSAISGTAHGVRQAFEEFGRSMELTGGDLTLEPVHLLADEEMAVALFEVVASRPDGRRIRQKVIHEWRFSDGKVQGIREWIWDQAADVAFWA